MQVAVDARSWRSVSGWLPKCHYGAIPETRFNERQRLSEYIPGEAATVGWYRYLTILINSPLQMEADPVISDDWSVEDALA